MGKIITWFILSGAVNLLPLQALDILWNIFITTLLLLLLLLRRLFTITYLKQKYYLARDMFRTISIYYIKHMHTIINEIYININLHYRKSCWKLIRCLVGWKSNFLYTNMATDICLGTPQTSNWKQVEFCVICDKVLANDLTIFII